MGALRTHALAWLVLAWSQGGPGTGELPSLGSEGPLRNDVFLPVSRPAQEATERGDRALARSRQAGVRAEDAKLARGEAFEAWREALSVSALGDSIGSADPATGTARMTEGVAHAILRRLRGLGERERAGWRARLGELAEAELGSAGADPARLSAVERGYPATLAAARAALVLCDLAIESGHVAGARTWAGRGKAHLDLAGIDAGDPLAAALERRRLWCETQGEGERRSGAAQSWRSARRLVPLGGVAWERSPQRGGAIRPPEPGRGIRPGLAFLDDGRLAVQTADTVLILRHDARNGLVRDTSFHPAELLRGSVEPPPPVDRAVGPPGWPLLPATDGRDLVLVCGRADLRRNREASNALLCLRTPPAPPGPADPGPIGIDGTLPWLRWAVVGDLHVDAEGKPTPVPGLAELALAEIQPGPVRIGSLVLAQARRIEGGVRAWLLAFDLQTGRLVWKRFLAEGADLLAERGRFSSGAVVRGLASQPLAAVGERVFAGTHLGAGVLLDGLDGRPVWSIRCRRRNPASPGWSGERPVPPLGPPGGQARLLLWAPADSDRLYTLDADPRARGTDGLPFAAPPRPMGEAEVLLGGDAERFLALGRFGRARTVTSWENGVRIDGIHLGREERFTGAGLASPQRVLVPSDRGLYLFDPGRELYLLDYRPLAPLGTVRGGELAARGDRVYVVGPDALWAFRAE